MIHEQCQYRYQITLCLLYIQQMKKKGKICEETMSIPVHYLRIECFNIEYLYSY